MDFRSVLVMYEAISLLCPNLIRFLVSYIYSVSISFESSPYILNNKHILFLAMILELFHSAGFKNENSQKIEATSNVYTSIKVYGNVSKTVVGTPM